MNNVPESIIARIAKLLGLAQSDNVNEAAVAAAQAQRLMDAYRLSEAQVLVDKDPMERTCINGSYQQNLVMWKARLAQAVADANGCYVMVNGGAIVMLGRASDVAVSAYFFNFLVREIDKITLKSCKGNGKTYANNFRLGAIITIQRKMQEDRRSQVTGSDITAMVLDRSKNAKTWHESNCGKGKTRVVSAVSKDYAAMREGMKAAESINLTRGIETTPEHRRLA